MTRLPAARRHPLARGLLAVALAATLAACGDGSGASGPDSAPATSACQGRTLVGTRMSCPPSAAASASH